MLLAEVNLVALVLPIVVVAAVGAVYLRARRRLFRGPDDRPIPGEPTFPERALVDVERTLERLIAEGRIEVERAAADGRSQASMPSPAGPVLARWLREVRSVRLVDADLTLELHGPERIGDAIGGWRLRASDEAVDVRIGCGADGEAVIDATWSPAQGHEVVRHSTLTHFIVRSTVGDRV